MCQWHLSMRTVLPVSSSCLFVKSRNQPCQEWHCTAGWATVTVHSTQLHGGAWGFLIQIENW